MFKKMSKRISALLAAFAMCVSLAPITSSAQAPSQFASYSFESFVSPKNGGWSDNGVVNDLDNSAYPMSSWYQILKPVNENTVYTTKNYVRVHPDASTQQTIIRQKLSADLAEKLNGDMSFDTWFIRLEDNSNLNMICSIENLNAKSNGGDKSDRFLAVFYDKENKRITVERRIDADTVADYYYKAEPDMGKWYHLGFSYGSGVTPPELTLNGAKLVLSGVTPDSLSTDYADKEFTPYTTDMCISFGRGVNQGAYANSVLGYGKISLYSGLLTEADFAEVYNNELKLYEKEFKVLIKDGWGEEVSQSGLSNIIASNENQPVIEIDTEGLDGFNTDTVKLWDNTTGSQIAYNARSDQNIYTLQAEYEKGHSYRLIIDGILNAEGELVRKTAQELEFGITQNIPEMIANYEMHDDLGLNSLDSAKYPISGTVKKFSTFGNNYSTLAGSPYTYSIPGIVKDMTDKFVVDLWLNPTSTVAEPILLSISKPTGEECIRLMQIGNGLAVRKYFADKNDSSKTAYLEYMSYNGTYGGNLVKISESVGKTFNDSWHHLVFMYDEETAASLPGAEQFKNPAGIAVYFDGVKLDFYNNTFKTDFTDYKAFEITDEHELYLNNLNGTRNSSRYRIGKTSIYSGTADEAFLKKIAQTDLERYAVPPATSILNHDGTEISRDTAVEAGTQVYAKADNVTGGTLVFAVYNNGKLKDIKIADEITDKAIITEEYTTGSGDSFKVMLIDSLNGIKPIIESNNYISE